MEIKVGKKTYRVLFPDLLRPLNERERIALKKSINRRGIQSPVIVDENDDIIDGANRASVAAELKIDTLPTKRIGRGNMTDDEKAQLCVDLNAARRHLKPGEMKELMKERQERVERVVVARSEGKSTREIAKGEGVSQPQIIADIQTATDKGLSVPTPEKITGLDGKQRPSTRKPKAAPVEPTPQPTAPEPQPAKVEAPAAPPPGPTRREQAIAALRAVREQYRDEASLFFAWRVIDDLK